MKTRLKGPGTGILQDPNGGLWSRCSGWAHMAFGESKNMHITGEYLKVSTILQYSRQLEM